MITWAKFLWIAGSALIGTLGTVHLLYTFFTNKFYPRDEKLLEGMKNVSPVLTKDISMWNAWVGFNGSHSSGIMFIAVLNIFLAVKFFPVLQKSHFYFIFNIITVGFYVFLAQKYWFSKPLIGACITLLCYCIAYILILLNK